MLLGYNAVLHLLGGEFKNAIYQSALQHPTSLPAQALSKVLARVRPRDLKCLQKDPAAMLPVPFHVNALKAIAGEDTVATPYEIPLDVEDDLRRNNLYRPDFYDHTVAVLHSAAEQHKILEFNNAMWAMLPADEKYELIETQTNADAVMGIRLPYKAIRKPYVAGVLFNENLQKNWRIVGRVDQFNIYCNTRSNPACGSVKGGVK
jgi:hypothetical protein